MKSKSSAEDEENVASGKVTPDDESKVDEDPTKFVQAGSYQDYFAQKMAALKAKGKFANAPAWTESKGQEEVSCTPGLGSSDNQDVDVVNESEEPVRKSKKKKKSKDE